MKIFVPFFILLFLAHNLFGGPTNIKISNDLELVRLSDETYMHISEGSNGMLTIHNGKCIIISTPPTDAATQRLIDWVNDSLKATIIGVVIDSWHYDNMEGLDIIQAKGIKSFANEKTREMASLKGLPVPDIGFNDRMELNIDQKKLILRYFGPAHTDDGIMVWIPDELILFGNNGVRNNNGWIGNIGDASLSTWSATIEKARAEFSAAKWVIPGHGPCGGIELLDYTIALYRPTLWGKWLIKNAIEPMPVFSDYGRVFIAAQSDSINGKVHHVRNARVFADKGEQYLLIEAPMVIFNETDKSIRSESGRLQILNKTESAQLPEAGGYYKKLSVDFRTDAIGMTIVLKELIQ